MFQYSTSSSPHRQASNLPARLRGGADKEVIVGVCGCACCSILVWIFISVLTVSALPNEYGILLSTWEGKINGPPVRGGVHLRWSPWNQFFKFPATQVTVIWADGGSTMLEGTPDMPAVYARSGHDKAVNETIQASNNEASGQPVWIHCAMQYKYIEDELPELYYNLVSHEKAKERYEILARAQIIQESQNWSPQDFWLRRNDIAMKMQDVIDDTLKQYHAKVTNFQILKLDFQDTFENAVTNTQVEEQVVTVNSFTQKVVQVMKEIDRLKAENDKRIATIDAEAKRISKELIANATSAVFTKKQTVKAEKYKEFKEQLKLNMEDMEEYIKIKSFITKSQSGQVIVNVPEPNLTTEGKSEL